MTARHKAICAAIVFLEKEDGSIFLIERVNTGWRDGEYDGLSGHIEKGEKAADAAIREAEEEGGVIISKNDLRLVHVISLKREDSDDDAHYFYFVSRKWEGIPDSVEEGKRGKVLWVNKKSFHDIVIVPPVRQAISNYWNGILYSEYNPKFINAKSKKL